MTPWATIHTYLQTRLASYERERIAVPLDAIRKVELEVQLRFPQTYIDFLVCAGERSGTYAPFSTRFAANFHAIVERIGPGTRYPIERFWPVGLELDINGEFDHPFLDLARSDSIDAPLVTFEPRRAFAGQEVRDLMYTLAEELAANAFYAAEVSRRPFTADFVLFPDQGSYADALDYLALAGLEEQVHAGRLRLFDGPVAVALFDWAPNIGVELAGEDVRECWRVANILRDNIPGGCSEIEL